MGACVLIPNAEFSFSKDQGSLFAPILQQQMQNVLQELNLASWQSLQVTSPPDLKVNMEEEEQKRLLDYVVSFSVFHTFFRLFKDQ